MGKQLITNPSAAASLSDYLNQLVALTQSDPALNVACMKFQMEHASAKAIFEEHHNSNNANPQVNTTTTSPSSTQQHRDGGSPTDGSSGSRSSSSMGGDSNTIPKSPKADEFSPTTHLRAALRRALDFSLSVSSAVLQRAVKAYDSSPHTPTTNSFNSAAATTHEGHFPSIGHYASAFAGPADEQRCSSVEDLSLEDMAEQAATIADASANILCLVFLVSEPLRKELQQYALDKRLLEYLQSALVLDRQVEMACFAEGFKTIHMNVASNFTFGSEEVCAAYSKNEPLMKATLQGTKIDEENPGMVEWAEFALRNVCEVSDEARQFIRGLKRSAV